MPFCEAGAAVSHAAEAAPARSFGRPPAPAAERDACGGGAPGSRGQWTALAAACTGVAPIDGRGPRQRAAAVIFPVIDSSLRRNVTQGAEFTDMRRPKLT